MNLPQLAEAERNRPEIQGSSTCGTGIPAGVPGKPAEKTTLYPANKLFLKNVF